MREREREHEEEREIEIVQERDREILLESKTLMHYICNKLSNFILHLVLQLKSVSK